MNRVGFARGTLELRCEGSERVSHVGICSRTFQTEEASAKALRENMAGSEEHLLWAGI